MSHSVRMPEFFLLLITIIGSGLERSALQSTQTVTQVKRNTRVWHCFGPQSGLSWQAPNFMAITSQVIGAKETKHKKDGFLVLGLTVIFYIILLPFSSFLHVCLAVSQYHEITRDNVTRKDAKSNLWLARAWRNDVFLNNNLLQLIKVS